MFSYVKFVALL